MLSKGRGAFIMILGTHKSGFSIDYNDSVGSGKGDPDALRAQNNDPSFVHHEISMDESIKTTAVLAKLLESAK